MASVEHPMTKASVSEHGKVLWARAIDRTSGQAYSFPLPILKR